MASAISADHLYVRGKNEVGLGTVKRRNEKLEKCEEKNQKDGEENFS